MSGYSMDKIVALCKNRGFVFAGSELYGGLANAWDYGPLGVEMKNNVKKAWWRKFVQENEYNVGLDSAILMNPEVWVASGHVVNFNDPLWTARAARLASVRTSLLKNTPKSMALTIYIQTVGRTSRCPPLSPKKA